MFRRAGPCRQIHCPPQRSTAPVVGLWVLSSSCERGPGRLANFEGEAWALTVEVVDGGVKLQQAVEGGSDVGCRPENQDYVTSRQLMVTG